jgi:uncharacterized peroxidase-related enzyme
MLMSRLTPVVRSSPIDASKPAQVQRQALPCNNFLLVLANSDAATEAYQACETALQKGQLSPSERELLALTIAEIHGSRYCLSAHRARALQLGLTDAQVRQARRAVSDDPRTAALLRFAQTVALQRGEVGDAELQKAREAGLTDAIIAETLANIALHVFTNYFNLVARTEVDFPLLKPGVELSAE